MDLSSLEGPPICDPRFTPQARYHQPDTYIPSIRVDDTYNPRYPSGHYYRNTDYRDVSSSTGPRLNPTSNTGTGTSGSVESRPRARSNPPPLQRQPESSTTSRPSTPNRLIWLDGEKTWLLIEARGLEQMQPPRLERQHSRPQSLPRPPQPQPLQRSRPQRQRQRQHQHQCQCLYQGQGADQPPSYGDHQHDRVIAVQPMGSRGRDEEEDDDDDDDEYEDEEPRPELARSKWGAVARRVNRMV